VGEVYKARDTRLKTLGTGEAYGASTGLAKQAAEWAHRFGALIKAKSLTADERSFRRVSVMPATLDVRETIETMRHS
jgi:hypothetical protein